MFECYYLIKLLALSSTNRGGSAVVLFFHDLQLSLLLYPSMLGQMEQKGQHHEKVTLHYCRMHDGMCCFLETVFLH